MNAKTKALKSKEISEKFSKNPMAQKYKGTLEARAETKGAKKVMGEIPSYLKRK